MMKLCVFMLIILASCVPKQEIAGNFIARDYLMLYSSIRHLDIDPLGNLFILNDQDKLIKVDSTGALLNNILLQDLGRIHSMDVGNPFKILLFYRDQQTIILCDNTLSEMQRIRLQDWQYQDVTAVCLAADNSIWLFDGEKRILVKLDETMKTIFTSASFDIIQPPSPRPDFIYDIDQLLLVRQENHPVAAFDEFGNYLQSFDEFGEDISFSGNYLIVTTENQIRVFDFAKRVFLPNEIANHPLDQTVYAYGANYISFDNKGIYLVTPIRQ
jgi:hypothetical protein